MRTGENGLQGTNAAKSAYPLAMAGRSPSFVRVVRPLMSAGFRRLIAIPNYRCNHPEAKVGYDHGVAIYRRGCTGVMLQDTGDLYLFVDVLREIFVRFDWVGIAVGSQRETMVALHHATCNALYRSTG